MDVASLFSPGPEFARASLHEGTEMLKLMDRSTLRELPSAPDEMELPPHREQRSLEGTLTYIYANGATLVMSQRPDPRLLPAGTGPRRGLRPQLLAGPA